MARLKPQQQLMNHYLVVWVMGCAIFSLLPHLTRMPVALAALLLLLTLWRVTPTYRNPPWILRTTAVLLAVAGIFWLNGGLWGRLPGSQLLCAMLILKSLELNYRRDALLMVSLSFFVVATWFLFDQSPLTFLYLVGATLLGLTTMIAINQREGSQPDIKAMFRSGGRLVLPAIPLALAMFFLFPRLSVPLWGIQGGELEGVTGLSSTMQPGSISDLFLDDGPAFRARFEGALPDPADSYWRGPVLWNFDGTVWRPTLYSATPARSKPQRQDADFSYEVELEPHRRRWLFSLDYPASVPKESSLTIDYQIRTRKPVHNVKRYQMHSDIDFVDDNSLPATLRGVALQLPEHGGEQARILADQWRTTASSRYSDDAQIAEQIVALALRHFRENPFFYRLDNLPILNDPIDDFLFDSQRGYCEHYASAFTYLMRAAGLPARVVTGYQGGTLNGDYVLIRQSDAHAWSEVWIDGRGWQRVDPTTAVSPARIIEGSRAVIDAPTWLHAPWLVGVRNRLDRVRHWWNQNIVSFDADRQTRMLRPMGIDTFKQKHMIAVLTVICVIIGCIIFVWYTRDQRRPQDRLSKAWLLLQKRLKKAGVDTASHLTSSEILHQASNRMPWHASKLQTIIREYNALRYSPLAEQHNEAFSARLQTFANHIRLLKLYKKPPSRQ